MNAAAITEKINQEGSVQVYLSGLPGKPGRSYSFSISLLNDGSYNIGLSHEVIGRDTVGRVRDPELIPILERFNASEVWKAHYSFSNSSSLQQFINYLLPNIQEIR